MSTDTIRLAPGATAQMLASVALDLFLPDVDRTAVTERLENATVRLHPEATTRDSEPARSFLERDAFDDGRHVEMPPCLPAQDVLDRRFVDAEELGDLGGRAVTHLVHREHGTLRETLGRATFLPHVAQVVGVRAQEQVVGTDAPSVVAAMAAVKPLGRPLAVRQEPGDAVCMDGPTIDGDLTVAVCPEGRLPFPTALSFDDFAPEARSERARRSCHTSIVNDWRVMST
ncbi:MAG TPA: hypothetical protein VM305_08465 [Candidatus Limnocylindrales bacterium]|nr:hypothetical protein [Candidatus Limnocylindrales bacterium]